VNGMTSRAFLAAMFVLSIADTPPLEAQPLQQRSAALSALPRASLVRVSRRGLRDEGRLEGVRGDTLLWRLPDGVLGIPVAELDSVWVTAGRATGKGALIGGAVGGVAFALAGVYIGLALCNNSNGCSDAYVPVGALGGLIGAGSGGLVGAGIGSLVRRWRRVYP